VSILSNDPAPASRKEAALAYAARGWRVLPIEPRGKKPLANLVPHGCHDATTDTKMIKRWWTAHPDANVGIACGAESGLWVLDLDGLAGIAEFNKWAAEHGEPLPTRTVSTPGGGLHLFYCWPTDRAVGNRARIGGKPVDVRGTGGYIVAPPSVGPAGRAYTAEHDAPIADAPEWLLDRVAPLDPPPAPVPAPSPPPPSRPLHAAADLDRRIRAYLSACPPAVSGSGGHNQTYTVACALVHGFGLSAAEALAYLAEWNQTCTPPWSEKELTHKLGDAETKGSPPPGKHRGYLRDESPSVTPMTRMGHRAPAVPAPPPKRMIPTRPWRPFPIEALPRVAQALVIEGSAAIGVDPAFFAVPLLAILAGAVGNARRLRITKTWLEPSVIWSALVADSGDGKSPVLRTILAPIEAYQSDRFREHKERLVTFDADMLLHIKRLDEWKRDKRGTRPPIAPQAPTAERLLVGDVTIEKLLALLSENPRGLLLVLDELAGWWGGHDRYRNKGGVDVPAWLSLYDAGSATVDRQKGGTIHVQRGAVSVTGGIQPAVLARVLTAAHREAGLAARFLFVKPPTSPQLFSEAEIGEKTLGDYSDVLTRLRELPVDVDHDGGLRPIVLDLTPPAKAAWKEFHNPWAVTQHGSSGDIKAAMAKLKGIAARLALIHHVFTYASAGLDDRVPVGVESIQAGTDLAGWFLNETERVYTLLSESPEERELRRLSEKIEKHGGVISARELARSNNRRYRTVEDALVDMRRLADAGLGNLSIETPTAGGHAHPVFRLHDARRMTLDLGTEDADPAPLHDTRNADPSNSKETGASVVQSVRRAEDATETTTEPNTPAGKASVVQAGEDREVFRL
jgi:hypothetical protein